MEALLEKLDTGLRLAEVIDLADHDALDLAPSRGAEQEVLDILDEPTSR
jgi:hypothetical protein